MLNYKCCFNTWLSVGHFVVQIAEKGTQQMADLSSVSRLFQRRQIEGHKNQQSVTSGLMTGSLSLSLLLSLSFVTATELKRRKELGFFV
jgi:hypothetical protein